MDSKTALAKKAVSLIQHKMIAGLGASSAMPYVIDCLQNEIKNGLQVRLVTSSFVTQQLLLEKGLDVFPVSNYSAIDIYFDGCDQFDRNLNAVKSGGGIHTAEKLLASMASQFVLLGDQTKYIDRFDIKYPLVLEVLPQACHYVQAMIKKEFPGATTAIRVSDKKIGAAITDNGNYLVDVRFAEWPDLESINPAAKSITGVVETSFFYQLAKITLLAGEEGVQVIEK